ncbi:11942_t:CDS:2 [Funneliformis geosporum]|uniref:14001_t:CDS:1 n=1 Tax=Funneliformis geosporum TaxID=1117311 RepID=A0A9W4SG65_9GLOM|nr:11942_t:CDS:2 [Funneliformis geosporum]CAI2167693.1 14001_t:CDS:2 [Funneliformis geosporum]
MENSRDRATGKRVEDDDTKNMEVDQKEEDDEEPASPPSKKRKLSLRSSSRKLRKSPRSPRPSTTSSAKSPRSSTASVKSPRSRTTSPKKGTSGATWTPEEDKVLIESILELLPPIPWPTIIVKLPERNTKSLQNRWQSLKKRLHV